LRRKENIGKIAKCFENRQAVEELVLPFNIITISFN